MTIVKPDDQRFERLSDDEHQNIGIVIDDALVVVAQGVIIFLTLKTRDNRSPNTALEPTATAPSVSAEP